MHLNLCVLRLSLALGATATGTPDDDTCSPGDKIATYDGLPSFPINPNPIGLNVTTFTYLDLNYTRFQPDPNPNASPSIDYVLSQLSAPPLSGILGLIVALAKLLAPGATLPPLYPPPSTTGATNKTTFQLKKLDLFCAIRNGGVPNLLPGGVARIPFPCYVKIRPVEPERSGEVGICKFTGAAVAAETCVINPPLAAGRGFTFETLGDVTSLSALGQLQSKLAGLAKVLDPLTEFLIYTTLDNVTYTQYC